jgi:hypothetical protein
MSLPVLYPFIGAQYNRQCLQIVNWDGTNATNVYTSNSVLSAVLWEGQQQASLFSPAVSWYTAGSTQTGYGQGQFSWSVTGTQTAALNPAGEYYTLVSQTTSGDNNGYVSIGQPAYNAALKASVRSDQVQTLFGDLITSTITIDTGFVEKHVWTADKTGLFRTDTDLGKEWRGYQQIVLNGGAASLNAIQLMEANAQVVFESTKIADLEKTNSKLVQKYREDAQRCFDARAAAMKIDQASLGLGQPMTKDAMVKLERTIWGSAELEELFMQGRGVNAPSAKYNGFEKDFKFADRTTTYVGEGWYSGRSALGSFFNDVILGYAGFGTVWNQGQLVQLDQNGNVVEGVGAAAGNLNRATLTVLKKSDFQR